MASFQRTLDRCHSQAKSLEASVGAIWQGIFSARFRDVDADIRAVVIRGIGDWMSMNPADFLNDAYLKYVAWALSDRVRSFPCNGPESASVSEVLCQCKQCHIMIMLVSPGPPAPGLH